MRETFGLSLVISGMVVALRTAATTPASAFGSVPNDSPPSFLHVRARHIDLERGDEVLFRFEAFGHIRVIFGLFAPDVHDHGRLRLLQARQVVVPGQEGVDTRPLQADGVQHAADHLRHARRRIAVRRPRGNALHDDRAELLDREEILVLLAVSECAGCGHDRVLQRERTEFYVQISHNTPPPPDKQPPPCSCANTASRPARTCPRP